MQSDSQRKRTFLVLLFLSLFKGFENTGKRENKKTSETFGSYALKFLPLHPLLKTKAARVDILLSRNGDRVFLPFSFCLPFDKRDDEEREKKKKWKKLPKIFGRYALKFLPLHPLSEKNSNRETSDLWTDLHKQYK